MSRHPQSWIFISHTLFFIEAAAVAGFVSCTHARLRQRPRHTSRPPYGEDDPNPYTRLDDDDDDENDDDVEALTTLVEADVSADVEALATTLVDADVSADVSDADVSSVTCQRSSSKE